jgi:hypothetical protein
VDWSSSIGSERFVMGRSEDHEPCKAEYGGGDSLIRDVEGRRMPRLVQHHLASSGNHEHGCEAEAVVTHLL